MIYLIFHCVMVYSFKEFLDVTLWVAKYDQISYRQFREKLRIDAELTGIIDQTLGKFWNILPNWCRKDDFFNRIDSLLSPNW